MSPARVAAVREHVGSGVPPTDGEIEAGLIRYGTIERTALHYCRIQLADMTRAASSFTSTGDYSEDFDRSISALTERVRRLEQAVASGTSPSSSLAIGQLVRPHQPGRTSHR